MVQLLLLLQTVSSGWEPTARPPEQPFDTAFVRDAVARQLAVDRAILGRDLSTDLSSEPFAVERLDLGAGLGIHFYRVTPWGISHWHPYILAMRDSVLVRLGGFGSPEVQTLGRWLHLDHREDSAFWDAALILATAGDPNGAACLAVPRSRRERDAPVIEAWAERRDASWPADAIARLPDGRVRIVLTVLSRADRLPGTPWYPVVWAFEFNDHGVLAVWASRKGAALATWDP